MSSIQEIVEAIKELSVGDLVELVKDIEEMFGVSASPIVMEPYLVDPHDEIEEPAEPDSYDVYMESFGAAKIQVIKVVRAVLGLGLKEAKVLVEEVPVTVKEDIPKDEAELFRDQLSEAGAVVSLREGR